MACQAARAAHESSRWMHLYSTQCWPDKQWLAQKVKVSYSQSTPVAPNVKCFVEWSAAVRRWNVLYQTSIYPPISPCLPPPPPQAPHPPLPPPPQPVCLLLSLEWGSTLCYTICWALGMRAKIMASGGAGTPTRITPQAFQDSWCLTSTLPPPWCAYFCL